MVFCRDAFNLSQQGFERQICNTAADHAANNGNSLLEKSSAKSCFVIFTLNHFATLYDRNVFVSAMKKFRFSTPLASFATG